MRGKILLAGLVALAVALSGCVGPTACTEEGKLRPDGSYVARNPALNCEFDPCQNLRRRRRGILRNAGLLLNRLGGQFL